MKKRDILKLIEENIPPLDVEASLKDVEKKVHLINYSKEKQQKKLKVLSYSLTTTISFLVALPIGFAFSHFWGDGGSQIHEISTVEQTESNLFYLYQTLCKISYDQLDGNLFGFYLGKLGGKLYVSCIKHTSATEKNYTLILQDAEFSPVVDKMLYEVAIEDPQALITYEIRNDVYSFKGQFVPGELLLAADS